MSLAAEAELGELFINVKTAVPIRTTLEELWHKQPPTPIQTDNSTANGVVNNEIQPKATKAMDMRFYWLEDRDAKKQLIIYWWAGKLNKGCYVTKHHPAIHHQSIHPTLLTPWKVVEALHKKLRGLTGDITGCGKGMLDKPHSITQPPCGSEDQSHIRCIQRISQSDDCWHKWATLKHSTSMN